MKVIHNISRISGYVATGMLGIMMMVTVADVFMRYVFNRPITGTKEISEFLLVIVVFLALAWCAVARKHVKVDLLMSRFSMRTQLIVDTITLLAVLGIYVIITWQSFLESTEVDTITSIIKLPHSPLYWIMTLGFAIFCLAIISLVIENVIEASKR